MRHEIKFSISLFDDLILAKRLSKILKHDKNADSRGVYRVNSIYFDTPYDEAYHEKIRGVDPREKFRIRYYNSDTSFIQLEKKVKIKGLCKKYSVRLTKDEVQSILDKNYDFLLNKNNALCVEFYSKLKGKQLMPKTIVIYDREAFLYEAGNVRITLDRKLRFHSNLNNFLSLSDKSMDTSDERAILEVKYDEFLPEFIQHAIHLPGCHWSAISKYAICRRYE